VASIISKNPYIKTIWRDHIVDIISGKVIQEGTRFTANRANNIEEGIFNLFDYLLLYDEEMQKLRIQLEMVGRAPTNNGTFFDTLSDQEPKALALQEAKAVVQLAYPAGTTVLELNDVPFTVGQFITIYDDEMQEDVQVTAVDTTANTITVTALQNAYKKGAFVARTNSIIDRDVQEMTYGVWGTYSIAISEVV
jgi:hypothetical protein